MENKLLTTTQKEKNFSRNLPATLSEIKISGLEVVATTNQELCIASDSLQLSSLVVRKTEMVEEKIDIQVGKFKRIGTVKKQKVVEVDNSKLITLIQLMILDVFEWFGKTDISPEIRKSLANRIYENYYWFKISELKLFSERLKAGYWKQVHNMSPAVLMERMAEFASDSMIIREQLGDIQVSEQKQNEKDSFIPMSDKQKEEFTKFADSLAKKYDKTQVNTDELHKNADKTIAYWKENEEYLKWLKGTDMSEMEQIRLYNEYLKRK